MLLVSELMASKISPRMCFFHVLCRTDCVPRHYVDWMYAGCMCDVHIYVVGVYRFGCDVLTLHLVPVSVLACADFGCRLWCRKHSAASPAIEFAAHVRLQALPLLACSAEQILESGIVSFTLCTFSVVVQMLYYFWLFSPYCVVSQLSFKIVLRDKAHRSSVQLMWFNFQCFAWYNFSSCLSACIE